MKKVVKPYRFQEYKTAEEFAAAMAADGLEFPVSNDLGVLFEPLIIGNKVIPNRLCSQPCEGFDGETDGSPSDLDFW